MHEDVIKTQSDLKEHHDAIYSINNDNIDILFEMDTLKEIYKAHNNKFFEYDEINKDL